jgi:hypothetical protein
LNYKGFHIKNSSEFKADIIVEDNDGFDFEYYLLEFQ